MVPSHCAHLPSAHLHNLVCLRLVWCQVAAGIPRVAWVSASQAMHTCTLAMPKGTPNHPQVVKFAQESLFKILHIMVGLNNVDNNPRSFSGLQTLWADDLFDEFSRCFMDGLASACRYGS